MGPALGLGKKRGPGKENTYKGSEEASRGRPRLSCMWPRTAAEEEAPMWLRVPHSAAGAWVGNSSASPCPFGSRRRSQPVVFWVFFLAFLCFRLFVSLVFSNLDVGLGSLYWR